MACARLRRSAGSFSPIGISSTKASILWIRAACVVEAADDWPDGLVCAAELPSVHSRTNAMKGAGTFAWRIFDLKKREKREVNKQFSRIEVGRSRSEKEIMERILFTPKLG